MVIELNELQSELEVYSVIKETKLDYHLYIFNNERLELWNERIIDPEESKAEINLQRRKSSTTSTEKRKAGRRRQLNLAMSFMNNMFKSP